MPNPKVGDKVKFETPDGKQRVGKVLKVMNVNVKLEAGTGSSKQEFVVKKDRLDYDPILGALPKSKSKKETPKKRTPPMEKKPRGLKKNRAEKGSRTYKK